MLRHANRPPRIRGHGFTLVELLIVISILLILTTLVLVLYNTNMESERIRGAARQMQSVFLGAQSRAALKKTESRGLRLILDNKDPTVAMGFAYVAPSVNYGKHLTDAPTMQIQRYDANDDGDLLDPGDDATPRYLRNIGAPGVWKTLYDQKLLVDGARINIKRTPTEQGRWYTVNVDPTFFQSDREFLYLNTDYPGTTGTGIAASPILSYELELEPHIVGDEQPVLLPTGIVVDLYHSRIPQSWYHEKDIGDSPGTKHRGRDGKAGTADDIAYTEETPPNTPDPQRRWRVYLPWKLDFMFTPRGMARGALGAQGVVHLVLADTYDTDQRRLPIRAERENMLVTLLTRTGSVSTHRLFVDLGADGAPGAVNVDDDNNGTIDDVSEVGWGSTDDTPAASQDIYFYAATGQVAGK